MAVSVAVRQAVLRLRVALLCRLCVPAQNIRHAPARSAQPARAAQLERHAPILLHASTVIVQVAEVDLTDRIALLGGSRKQPGT